MIVKVKNEQKNNRKRTIASDLTIRLIAIILILGIIQGTIFSLFYKKTSFRDLNTIIENMKDDFRTSIKPLLWDLNYTEIQNISKAYLKNEYLAAIRIVSTDGKTLVYIDTLKSPKGMNPSNFDTLKDELIHKNQDITIPKKGENQLLGNLDLLFSNEATKKTERFVIISIIIINLIIVTVIVISTSSILDRLLNRPMKKLIKNIKIISKGDFEYINFPSVPQRDINEIWQEVSKMAKDLKNREKFQADAFINATLRENEQMARWILHNIKSPLQPIFNSSDPVIKERAKEINKCLEQYRKFSEKKEEKVILYHSIDEILSDALDFTRLEINDNKITLVTKHLAKDLPSLRINRQKILQVFIAIIQNAVYALNQKFPLDNNRKKNERKILEIESSLVGEETREKIRIAFFDQGTGIPLDIRDKVFNANFSTKPDGTGLGLYFASEAIKSQHGKLSIETNEDEFTRVFIDLPVM